MAQRYFPQEEYEARWRRALAAMADQGFETAVVWGRSGGTYERCGDVLYLTNYYGNHSGQTYDRPRALAAVILRQGMGPELLADEVEPRSELVATPNAKGYNDTVKAVANALNAGGTVGRVALVGSDFFPMRYWQELQAETPTVDWVPADGLIRDLRRIKSARECDAFREGGQTVTRALDALMKTLLAGKTEAEAAGEAAREVFRGGGHIHMAPVSHGRYMEHFASDPLPAFNQEAAQEGEMLRAWVYGPMFQGYWLDPGRTAVMGGKPSAAQRTLIEATADMVEQMMAAIKPGVLLRSVVEIGQKLTATYGGEVSPLAEKWPFGHGLGLFFEKPYISAKLTNPDDIFEENMVFGVEAFLAAEGLGSAGVEQNVIVTRDGVELLTHSPMLW